MRLLMSPPRRTTKGCVRYEEMMLSSNVVAESIPTETASYTRGVVVVSIHLLDARPSTYGTHLADGKMAETAD